MVNKELVSFLRRSLARGHKEDHLIQGLRAKGWPVNEINDAFRIAKLEESLEPGKKISEAAIGTTFKLRKKGSDLFVNILGFIGMFIVVLILFCIFFYMNGKIKCYEESCADMNSYSLDLVRDSLTTSVALSLVIAGVFTIFYLLLGKRNIVFWIFNILLALAVVTMLIFWFIFTKSIS